MERSNMMSFTSKAFLGLVLVFGIFQMFDFPASHATETPAEEEEDLCDDVGKECNTHSFGVDTCCKPWSKAGKYGKCVHKDNQVLGICNASECILSRGKGSPEQEICVPFGTACCDKNEACVSTIAGESADNNGRCMKKTELCIAGTSGSSSEKCDIESKDPKKKCCAPGDSFHKRAGRCVDSTCKCIADGESCSAEDFCCNEGEHTLSCRDGKCQIATADERKECVAGKEHMSASPLQCVQRSSDPTKTCCALGDNPDKQPGSCTDNGMCVCVKDGDFCNNGYVCCNEGKDGRTCRSLVNGDWRAPKKCLMESETHACRNEGQSCGGTYGHFDPCCDNLACPLHGYISCKKIEDITG